MDAKKFIIRQISVFSEKRPGRLAAIAHALGEGKINILAFSIVEANEFGVVIALVDHPEKAHEKLLSLGFNIAFTDVIAVKMKDQPGGLYEVAKILGDAGINIEYSYAYSGKDGAVLILHVDQVEDAIKKIKNSGVTLLERSVFH